jgi:hypothetical protein
MKNIFLAVAFAVATLNLAACAHKPAPVVQDSKCVKAPAKKCCHHKKAVVKKEVKKAADQ